MSGYLDASAIAEAAISSVAIEDVSLHAVMILRDRLNHGQPPINMRLFSLAEIKDIVDSTPDEVHFLVLAKSNQKELIKICYSSRIRLYNLQHSKSNSITEEFNWMSFQALADLPRELLGAVREELDV